MSVSLNQPGFSSQLKIIEAVTQVETLNNRVYRFDLVDDPHENSVFQAECGEYYAIRLGNRVD